jgi:hypothetical protein
VNVEIESCRSKEESPTPCASDRPQLPCSIPKWTASLDLLYGHTRTETHLWTLRTNPSVDLQREHRLKTSPGQTLDSRQPKRPNEAERTSGNTLVLSGNLPTILPAGSIFVSILRELSGLQDFQRTLNLIATAQVITVKPPASCLRFTVSTFLLT